jgi:hypothetical protein
MYARLAVFSIKLLNTYIVIFEGMIRTLGNTIIRIADYHDLFHVSLCHVACPT